MLSHSASSLPEAMEYDEDDGKTSTSDIEKHAERPSQSPNEPEKGGDPPATAVALDWDGPLDPENPFNWPLWKKIFNTSMPGLLSFAVTFGSSVYSPAVPQVMEQFQVSQVLALLPLSLYVAGLGFGPVLAAPISETMGRAIVYWVSVPLSMVFIVGSGFSQTLAQLIICRFFAGTFSSPALAVGSGTSVDIWRPDQRAKNISFYLLAPFLGPALGPVVGGFTAMNLTWRWTQWDILFVVLPIYIVSLFMTETYKKIILRRRAKRLGIILSQSSAPANKLQMLKTMVTITLARPVYMLVAEPIVFFFSLYVGFSFAVMFAFFAAFPIIFEGTYGFNPGESGLTFLAIGVGVVLAAITGILVDRYCYAPRHKAALREGKTVVAPEHRLYTAMLGSLGLPIGLFWFAWTARAEISWVSPVLAAIPFGWGNLCIFVSAALYLTDVYGPLAGASAMAANGLLRYLLGAGFPLFTPTMYNNIGTAWATSIFGFISIAMLPIPWILYKFGPRIRARSGYDTIQV